MTNEEMELIARIQKGESSAFRTMMEKYQNNIYYLAYDLTGNHQDAEDLSQEVFIKAYQALLNYRGDAKLSSWLYRIAVNAGIDRFRKKKTVPFSSSDPLLERESDAQSQRGWYSSEDIEKQTEAGILQSHLQKAIQKLTPRERSVFALRHYHDLSIKEIAEILSIADGTVKSLIFRAIQKLQHELAFYRQDLGMEELK